MPVVLGNRGAIPTKRKEILQDLRLNKNEIKTIIMNVLRSFIEMGNIFLDQ